MKKFNIIGALCVAAVAFPLAASYENVKKVNATPGMSTWTIARKHSRLADEITPTPIFSTDTTISASGCYVLVEDRTTALTIEASDVCLDMAGHTITVAMGYGVSVDSGYMDVAIHDGVIYGGGVYVDAGCSNIAISRMTMNAPVSGVYVQPGCSNISVTETVVTNATGYGIFLGAGCVGADLKDLVVSLSGGSYGLYADTGCSGINFKDSVISGAVIGAAFDTAVACTLSGLKFISVVTGLSMTSAETFIVRDCHTMYATQYGFSLINSKACCLYDCSALRMQGPAEVAGFVSQGGQSNMFQRCVAKQISTTSGSFNSDAYGFLLAGSEVRSKIVDCIVNEVSFVSTQSSASYGIATRTGDLGAVGIVQLGNTLRPALSSLAISPDSKYLAECWNSPAANNVQISMLSPDSGSVASGLTQISTGSACTSVAWSPDGKYLAVGMYARVSVYSFDGRQLSATPANFAIGTFGAFGYAWGLAWSPNGKFLVATSDQISSGYGAVYMLQYDAAAGTLTAIDTALGGGQSFPSGNLYLHRTGRYDFGIHASWHPDGSCVLLSCLDSSNVANDFRQLIVMLVSESGRFIDWKLLGVGVGVALLRSVFSPNGRFIAAAADAGGGDRVRVYEWNGSSILPQYAYASAVNPVQSVAWSPDGKYIAAGIRYLNPDNSRVSVYAFQDVGSLSLQGTAVFTGATASGFAAIAWSPNGRFIFGADYQYSGVNSYHSPVSALSVGARNCLVDNCRVCDVLNNGTRMGIAYMGALGNLFTRNIAGNTPVDYSYGIPNVYDGRFELYPGRSTAQPFDNVSMPTTL